MLLDCCVVSASISLLFVMSLGEKLLERVSDQSLTYEVIGAPQVVVPHRHLQRLVGQLRQRDLVEELLPW